MQRKRSVHIPKGMTKDVSDSKLDLNTTLML